MKNEDITVVVQGPVQSLPERRQDEGITVRCLGSVRTHLAGAHIILSTWNNQDLNGLDYDELVINADPGANICGYDRRGEPRRENTNRQIVSTAGGLHRVKTRYALKLRADNYLTGSGFKELQQRYVERCEEFQILLERVVVTNTLARRYYHGRRVAFFLSDFFDFGLTEDLINIWDLPMFEDYPFDAGMTGTLQHAGAPVHIFDVDQILALAFINKNREPKVEMRDRFDNSSDLLHLSDVFFANNFVVATADQIGLGLPLKFTEGRQARPSSKASCLAASEWQRLYRRHCDPSFVTRDTLVPWLKIWLLRLLHLPLKRIESAIRAARDKRRHARVVARMNR